MEKIYKLYSDIKTNLKMISGNEPYLIILEYRINELYSRYRNQIRRLIINNKELNRINNRNQKEIKRLNSMVKQWKPLTNYLKEKNIEIYDFVNNFLSSKEKNNKHIEKMSFLDFCKLIDGKNIYDGNIEAIKIIKIYENRFLSGNKDFEIKNEENIIERYVFNLFTIYLKYVNLMSK